MKRFLSFVLSFAAADALANPECPRCHCENKRHPCEMVSRNKGCHISSGQSRDCHLGYFCRVNGQKDSLHLERKEFGKDKRYRSGLRLLISVQRP